MRLDQITLIVTLLTLGCSAAPRSPQSSPRPLPRPVVLWGPGGDINAPAPGFTLAKRGRLCPKLAVDGDGRLFAASSFRSNQENTGERIVEGRFFGRISESGGFAWIRDSVNLESTHLGGGGAPGFVLSGEVEAKDGSSESLVFRFDEEGRMRWVRSIARDTWVLQDSRGNVLAFDSSTLDPSKPTSLKKYDGKSGRELWRRDLGTIRAILGAGLGESMYLLFTPCKEFECAPTLDLMMLDGDGNTLWSKTLLTVMPDPDFEGKRGKVPNVTIEIGRAGNIHVLATFDHRVGLTHRYDRVRGGDVALRSIISLRGGTPTHWPDDDAFLLMLDPRGELVDMRQFRADKAAFGPLRLAVDTNDRPWIVGRFSGPELKLQSFTLRKPSLPWAVDEEDFRQDPGTQFIARLNQRGDVLMAAEIARGFVLSLAQGPRDIFLTSSYAGDLLLKGTIGAKRYNRDFGCAVLRIPLDYDPRAFEASR